jgi:hypothetical protein
MRLSSCLLCLLVLCASSPQATTYLVRPDGTGQFPTIQAALDAVVDGDVIELTEGTFTGEGNRDLHYWGKAVTVRSQSGDPALCVIDCLGGPGAEHRAFNFIHGEGRSSLLEAVTITHGYSVWGGGMTCVDASPTIRGCVFRENYAPGSEGGGLLVDSLGEPLVEDCLFTENSAFNGGGVSICFAFLGGPELVRCTFWKNTAHEGGGVRF